MATVKEVPQPDGSRLIYTDDGRILKVTKNKDGTVNIDFVGRYNPSQNTSSSSTTSSSVSSSRSSSSRSTSSSSSSSVTSVTQKYLQQAKARKGQVFVNKNDIEKIANELGLDISHLDKKHLYGIVNDKGEVVIYDIWGNEVRKSGNKIWIHQASTKDDSETYEVIHLDSKGNPTKSHITVLPSPTSKTRLVQEYKYKPIKQELTTNEIKDLLKKSNPDMNILNVVKQGNQVKVTYTYQQSFDIPKELQGVPQERLKQAILDILKKQGANVSNIRIQNGKIYLTLKETQTFNRSDFVRTIYKPVKVKETYTQFLPVSLRNYIKNIKGVNLQDLSVSASSPEALRQKVKSVYAQIEDRIVRDTLNKIKTRDPYLYKNIMNYAKEHNIKLWDIETFNKVLQQEQNFRRLPKFITLKKATQRQLSQIKYPLEKGIESVRSKLLEFIGKNIGTKNPFLGYVLSRFLTGALYGVASIPITFERMVMSLGPDTFGKILTGREVEASADIIAKSILGTLNLKPLADLGKSMIDYYKDIVSRGLHGKLDIGDFAELLGMSVGAKLAYEVAPDLVLKAKDVPIKLRVSRLANEVDRIADVLKDKGVNGLRDYIKDLRTKIEELKKSNPLFMGTTGVDVVIAELLKKAKKLSLEDRLRLARLIDELVHSMNLDVEKFHTDARYRARVQEILKEIIKSTNGDIRAIVKLKDALAKMKEAQDMLREIDELNIQDPKKISMRVEQAKKNIIEYLKTRRELLQKYPNLAPLLQKYEKGFGLSFELIRQQLEGTKYKLSKSNSKTFNIVVPKLSSKNSITSVQQVAKQLKASDALLVSKLIEHNVIKPSPANLATVMSLILASLKLSKDVKLNIIRKLILRLRQKVSQATDQELLHIAHAYAQLFKFIQKQKIQANTKVLLRNTIAQLIRQLLKLKLKLELRAPQLQKLGLKELQLLRQLLRVFLQEFPEIRLTTRGFELRTKVKLRLKHKKEGKRKSEVMERNGIVILKYTPSVVSLLLGIKGKVPSNIKLTGLEIRPIPKNS